VTGEVVTSEDLGGPAAQMNRSGVVHLIAEDDEGAIALCRRLLSFLPSNNMEEAPRLPYSLALESDPELNYAVPVDPKIAYDVRSVVKRILDHHDFFEIQPGFAANVVIGFGRLQGRSVGIVANQPSVMAGVLDIDTSDKIAPVSYTHLDVYKRQRQLRGEDHEHRDSKRNYRTSSTHQRCCPKLYGGDHTGHN